MTKTKKVLITGASGLVGSRLAIMFFKSGWKVYGTYLRNSIELGGIKRVYIDIRDIKELEETVDDISPHIIIHCAAMSKVKDCENNEDSAFIINKEGTKNIAYASKRKNIPMVYISTDLVFDGKKGNYKETESPTPINIYGTTKKEGEDWIKYISPKYLILRISLAYSYLHPHPKDFLSKLKNDLERGVYIRLFEDQIRTPTAIEDIYFAIVESYENDIFNETIHVGSPKPVSRYEIGELVAKRFNLSMERVIKSKVEEFFFNKVFIQPNCSLNVEKFRAIYGRSPIDIETGIKLFQNF